MKRFILFSCLAILIFSSCSYIGGKRVNGNGNVISQNRTTGSFNAVDVSGALDVYLKQDSSQSIKVEADENLQELIEIHEQNGILYISPRENYNLNPSNKGIKIYVSAPAFRRFDVSGASNILCENKITSNESFDIDISGASSVKINVNAPSVNTEVSGASNLTIMGETRDFIVRGSGASGMKCFDLKTENTSVDISGACSAEVFASVKLDVEASGASGVKYRGTPAITQDISGASDLKKVD
jgi:hypothetical protein